MTVLDDADQVGKEIQMKRDAEKAAQQATEKAKEDAKKELDQHEENKQQGMV